MKFDQFGFLESEKDPEGDPGRIGDSTAETFRWYGLAATAYFLDALPIPDNIADHVASLYQRIHTDAGYLRHPLAPVKDAKGKNWREPDFSDDQAIALLMGLDAWGLHELGSELVTSIQNAGGKTGNGDYVHPTFIASGLRFADHPSNFCDFSILSQGLAMKYFPLHWNDGKWQKREWPVELASESTTDFLNWTHLIFQAERHGHTWITERARSIFTEDQIMEKINSYYAKEPNPLILAMYRPVVRGVFGG